MADTGRRQDALRAAELYFSRSVVLLAVVALALPPLQESLKNREAAASLYSWLLLRSAIGTVNECLRHCEFDGQFGYTLVQEPCRHKRFKPGGDCAPENGVLLTATVPA